MHFDHWQRWGVDLDDVSFANAWVALGLALYGRDHSVRDLMGTSFPERKVRWDFPRRDTRAAEPPEEWAKAWVETAAKWFPSDPGNPMRLRVYSAPLEEPIRPWYRMLREAQPAPGAVSLAIPAPRAQLHIGWPLRLGYLKDDVREVLEATAKDWPSSKLTETVRLGRDSANCDFLVYKGQTSALLRDLLEGAVAVKANVMVLQGGEEDEWGAIQALLFSVLALTRASGFILVPREIEDKHFAATLNYVVRELSHARAIDAALGLAMYHTKPGDVVAGFTPALTRFTAPQLVERTNARIRVLPEGTEIDMSSVHVSRSQWLKPDVLVVREPRGSHVSAKMVSLKTEGLLFEQESQGATTIAELAVAAAGATPPREAEEQRAARFLQQRSFVRPGKEWQEAKDGFIANVPAMVRVRIAAPQKGWDVLPAAFPVDKLPQELESWTFTVWLTELDHLAAPIRRQIRLPRDGDSTECEFRFKPRGQARFEGRLTVVHRGRVIQTAVLRAGVAIHGEPRPKEGAPKLENPLAVRHRLGNLDERRQFDLAFVANHDAQGRPLLAAVSDKAAWIKDLSQMPPIASDINVALSAVAKSVKDYAQGLDGDRGRKLMIQLAQKGGWLKIYLDQQLNAFGNNPVGEKQKYVQIVSTRPDAVVPLEFVYDYQPPEDDATPCKHWREELETGDCRASCDRTSGKTFCPLGFWGLKRVIERHAVTPHLAKDGNVLYLEGETSRARDTLRLGGAALLSGSGRVPEPNMVELENLLATHCGTAPMRAKTWVQWEDFVKEHRPRLIVSLPHTDGKGANVTLEIGGQPAVKTITLRATHVFPPPVDGRQAPLVALLGCDTTGTADDYGQHVLVLRERGAAIVIGTIATVFGEHAAQVAGGLVEGMLPKAGTKAVRLGELMLEIKRKALLKGLLMPLCVVAYGDADWKLSREKPAND